MPGREENKIKEKSRKIKERKEKSWGQEPRRVG